MAGTAPSLLSRIEAIGTLGKVDGRGYSRALVRIDGGAGVELCTSPVNSGQSGCWCCAAGPWMKLRKKLAGANNHISSRIMNLSFLID